MVEIFKNFWNKGCFLLHVTPWNLTYTQNDAIVEKRYMFQRIRYVLSIDFRGCTPFNMCQGGSATTFICIWSKQSFLCGQTNRVGKTATLKHSFCPQKGWVKSLLSTLVHSLVTLAVQSTKQRLVFRRIHRSSFKNTTNGQAVWSTWTSRGYFG